MSVLVDQMLNPFTDPMLLCIETNPLRRGGPLRPPVRIDTVLPSVDAYAALAGWMHRVCAELAGCHENPVCWMLRLRWLVV